MTHLLVGGRSEQLGLLGNTTNAFWSKRRTYDAPSVLSPGALLGKWERFYRFDVGVAADLSGVTVPEDPSFFGGVVFIAEGVTLRQVIDACRRHFEVECFKEDLDRAITLNERTTAGGPYAVRIRSDAAAAAELQGLSAIDVEVRSLATMTLLERLVCGFRFFLDKKLHLDNGIATLCTGSRYAYGGIPSVGWSQGRRKLYVGCNSPEFKSANHRAARVVS